VRIAAVQLRCRPDVGENRARAGDAVADAVDRGAILVVLPELFAHLGPGRAMRDAAEPIDGPTVAWAAALASTHGIHLCAPIAERDGSRVHNTAVLVGPGGVVAAYRKIHLFDVEVPGAGLHESDVFSAGDRCVTAVVEGRRVGLLTCYDLRFCELSRILTLDGATVLLAPSAFTAATGPDHWELLVRTRAVENAVFVVAPDQCGTSPDGVARHGHSLIVDPWGRVLAAAGGAEETVLVADLDADAVDRARAAVPSLANRRPGAYRWPDAPR
jgi:predicted amidohydrolase